jgi:hypothetical protein
LQIFSKKFGSPDDQHRFLIAEDHKLAGVLDGMVSAAVQFIHEPPAPKESLDVFNLPSQHASLCGCFGAEQMCDPAIGIYGRWQLRHGESPSPEPAAVWLTRP